MLDERYEMVIGLEVHAQLLTASKIFSSDAVAFGDAPNRHVSLVSLAHPGTLPKLNERVLELAVRLGLACSCRIQQEMGFDRKNYFYPDLPKGYQITQQRTPFAVGGTVVLNNGVRVDLDHIHLEEDAGKSVHDGHPDESGIDFNRAGTPLVEIVTKPCMHSAADAALFLGEMRKIIRFLGVGDGNMEEGSLRADANVSVRLKGDQQLGRKVEIKNMNSMRHLRDAVEWEAARQVRCLMNGEEIISETRLYDPQSGETRAMRTKEELNDYRYFPDPDLGLVVLSDEWLREVRSRMPLLAEQYAEIFVGRFGLPEYDAGVLSSDPATAAYMLAVSEHVSDYKAASNWIMGPVKNWMNDHPGQTFLIPPVHLAELIDMIAGGALSHSLATRQIFPAMLAEPDIRPGILAEKLGLGTSTADDGLQAVVDEVIRIFPLKVEEYRNGRKALLAMFMGEIMKRTSGKADPKKAGDLLRKALSAE